MRFIGISESNIAREKKRLRKGYKRSYITWMETRPRNGFSTFKVKDFLASMKNETFRRSCRTQEWYMRHLGVLY